LLKRPHNKVEQLGARIAGKFVRIADCRRLPVAAPYIALMPQWNVLDFVSDVAHRYPGFELRQSCAGDSLLEEGGRVVGVRTSTGDDVRARLVIASDGRDSHFRRGFPKQVIGAPMDVFWFRLPKREQPENETMGVFETGLIFVLIDRGDYWQCAFVFPKGGAEQLKGQGLDAFKARVRTIGTETSTVDEAIHSWDDVSLLTVTVDRLDRWWRPGLLVIGDAAGAIDPGCPETGAGCGDRPSAQRKASAAKTSDRGAVARRSAEIAWHTGQGGRTGLSPRARRKSGRLSSIGVRVTWLMLILTVLMMPLVLLIKPPKGNVAVGLGHP
jgi:hypothetical protein